MLVSSLEFVLWIVAKLLCSCLCLFDAIVDLNAITDEKSSIFFSSESESGFYM